MPEIVVHRVFVHSAETIGRPFVRVGEIGRSPDPVPDRQLGGEIAAGAPGRLVVMPAVQLGAVEKIDEPTLADMDVGMIVHSPDRVERALYNGYLRAGAEQEYGRKFNRLRDDDLQRM